MAFSIPPAALGRRIGLPDCPQIIDVRTDEDWAADPRLIPGSLRRSHRDVAAWAPALRGQRTIISCQKGLKLSEGVAAWLRHAGAEAQVLEGGFLGWIEAGQPLLRTEHLPVASGSLWVTRQRPKVDRIACPWLIRRFVDRSAVFLFVAPEQVSAVADRFGAIPFDIDGVFWSHRGETCTFDTMLDAFGLATPALARLALLVRGADTARLDLAPQCAGLLAASLGLSRLYSDDLAQLDAGLALYDAFHLWCRDAVEETHNWPTPPGTRP
jgi:rhodanese-related sulfurtransferase